MDSLLVSVLFLMFFFIFLMSIRFIVRKNFATFMILLCQISLFSFLALSLINEVGVEWYIRVPAQIIGISIPFIIIINDLKNRNREVGYLHILDFLHDIFFPKKHEHVECIVNEKIIVKNSIHNIVNIRDLTLDGIDENTGIYKRMHRLLVHSQTKIFKGQFQDAYDIYNFFCKIFPDNSAIFYNQGCICFYLKDYNKAIRYFNRAYDNIMKHRKRNGVEENGYIMKKSDKAQSSDIIYNLDWTIFNLAVSKHASGRFEEAVSDYERVLAITPGNKMVMENLESLSNQLSNEEIYVKELSGKNG